MLGGPNQVVSASSKPAWLPSPTQATYPSGRTSTSVGGLDYTDVRPQYMTDSFTLPLLTEAEYQGKVLDLDRVAGTARNVLWLRTPWGTYQNDAAMLGRMTALAPAPSVAHNRRARQFQIKERL